MELALCLLASACLAAAPAQPTLGSAMRLVVTQLPVTAAARPAQLLDDPGQGARLALVERGRLVKVLTPGFASAADPDVSFDGRKILFAGQKQAGDRWAIYEMNADGTGVRLVTGGGDDCRQPIYLPQILTLTADPFKGTDAWDQIAFVRTSASEVNETGRAPASALFSLKTSQANASAVRLGANLSNEMDPTVLPDGRIVYASWQRASLARGWWGRIALLGMNPDGTDPHVFAADEGLRVKRMPCVTTRELVVFVEDERVGGDGAGALASVSLARNLHSYRRITTAGDGLFRSPSALPDGSVLAAMRPADGPGTYAIVRLDPATGASTRVFGDPGRHALQAKLLAPRPLPDRRSTPTKDDGADGILYGLDVYLNDLAADLIPKGAIKRLRVLEGLPVKPQEVTGLDLPLPSTVEDRCPNFMNPASLLGPPVPRLFTSGLPPLAVRRVLGEAPVEEDGSFQIQLPSNVSVQLQILDENGLAQRSSGWLRARSRYGAQGCVGCHEDGERVPPNRFVQALAKPAEKLNPPPEQRRTVDFKHDLAPIIQSRCVSCHGEGQAVRLDGGLEAQQGPVCVFCRAYQTLMAGLAPRADGAVVGKYVHPGQARTSPLIWHLFGRNTARPWDGDDARAAVKLMPQDSGLTEDERRLFIEWIDLGASWDATLAVPGGKER